MYGFSCLIHFSFLNINNCWDCCCLNFLQASCWHLNPSAQIPVCILIYLVLVRILDPYSCNFVIFLCILPLIFPGKSTWLDCCNSPLQLKIGRNFAKIENICESFCKFLKPFTMTYLCKTNDFVFWFACCMMLRKSILKLLFIKSMQKLI